MRDLTARRTTWLDRLRIETGRLPRRPAQTPTLTAGEVLALWGTSRRPWPRPGRLPSVGREGFQGE